MFVVHFLEWTTRNVSRRVGLVLLVAALPGLLAVSMCINADRLWHDGRW
jgi:hypothetical protein